MWNSSETLRGHDPPPPHHSSCLVQLDCRSAERYELHACFFHVKSVSSIPCFVQVFPSRSSASRARHFMRVHSGKGGRGGLDSARLMISRCIETATPFIGAAAVFLAERCSATLNGDLGPRGQAQTNGVRLHKTPAAASCVFSFTGLVLPPLFFFSLPVPLEKPRRRRRRRRLSSDGCCILPYFRVPWRRSTQRQLLPGFCQRPILFLPAALLRVSLLNTRRETPA